MIRESQTLEESDDFFFPSHSLLNDPAVNSLVVEYFFTVNLRSKKSFSALIF